MSKKRKTVDLAASMSEELGCDVVSLPGCGGTVLLIDKMLVPDASEGRDIGMTSRKLDSLNLTTKMHALPLSSDLLKAAMPEAAPRVGRSECTCTHSRVFDLPGLEKLTASVAAVLRSHVNSRIRPRGSLRYMCCEPGGEAQNMHVDSAGDPSYFTMIVPLTSDDPGVGTTFVSSGGGTTTVNNCVTLFDGNAQHYGSPVGDRERHFLYRVLGSRRGDVN